MAYLQMFAKYLNPKKVYELYEQYLPKITSYDTYLYNKMNLTKKELKMLWGMHKKLKNQPKI